MLCLSYLRSVASFVVSKMVTTGLSLQLFMTILSLLTFLQVAPAGAALTCRKVFSSKSIMSLDEIWQRQTSKKSFKSVKFHFNNLDTNPSDLVYVYGNLTKFKRDSRFSDEAAYMMLSIRRTLRLWSESENPELRMRAAQFSTYLGGKHLDPSEEMLLLSALSSKFSRDKLAGTVRKTIQTTSGEMPLKFQTEKERRVKLPSKDWIVSLEYGRSTEVKSMEDVVSTLLWKYFANLPYSHDFRGLGPVLSFQPLSSESTHFHSGNFVKQEIGNVSSFTKKIQNRIPLGREGDNISQAYIVTHQREVGTYFDTPSAELFEGKVALRIKEFYSLKENGTREVTRILFAKRTLETDDLFTNRTEYEVTLPPNATELQVREAMKELLGELGLDKAIADRLVVSEVIDNERYGFNLMWRNTVKIGFITVDAFRSQNADKAGHAAAGAFRQWEIEILPEFRKLTEMYPQEFKAFFQELETSFKGTLNPTPKAHQYLN